MVLEVFFFWCLSEKVFQGYQEGRINFKPTYKFDLETDNYDTSAKLRIPSYTVSIISRLTSGMIN